MSVKLYPQYHNLFSNERSDKGSGRFGFIQYGRIFFGASGISPCHGPNEKRWKSKKNPILPYRKRSNGNDRSIWKKSLFSHSQKHTLSCTHFNLIHSFGHIIYLDCPLLRIDSKYVWVRFWFKHAGFDIWHPNLVQREHNSNSYICWCQWGSFVTCDSSAKTDDAFCFPLEHIISCIHSHVLIFSFDSSHATFIHLLLYN